MDIKLTDEQREKLSSLAAIRPTREYNWVPKPFKELPKEVWPIFKINPPSNSELTGIFSKSYDVVEGQMKFSPLKFREALVRKMVVSWQNFRDDKLNLIEWKDSFRGNSNLTLEAYNMLKPEVIQDIEDSWNKDERLTEDEKTALGLPLDSQ